jgi:hypothetical protein
MCECTMIADGEFTPVVINGNKLSFVYIDSRGIRHTLIKEFAMNITISKASVFEVKDENGNIVAYEFKVE